MTHQRIILIGYRATGKTSTAKALAERLSWQWLDSDTEITKDDGRDRDIATIFAQDGEPAFRHRETEVLRRLVRESQVVIATGGGAILSEGNRQLLKAAGPVFWLTASAGVIRQRLAADAETRRNRPALAGADAVSEVEEVLAERRALYESCADYVVTTNERSPAEVADEIATRLREGKTR